MKNTACFNWQRARLCWLGTICLLALTSQGCNAQSPKTTTFFVVRHADRMGKADALTASGKERAQKLAEMLKHLRVAAVYSTDTARTRATAKPTADALQLSIKTYPGKPSSQFFSQLQNRHRGQTVLIVGHSNTVGLLVEELGGDKGIRLGDNEYDNLFVVSGDAPTKMQTVRLKFGGKNP